jgi:hypothetical protein
MIIKSLETMEKIVSENKTLSWEGWDVVQIFQDPVGWKKPEGVRIKGRWHVKKRFPLSENGWNIPEKMIRQ